MSDTSVITVEIPQAWKIRLQAIGKPTKTSMSQLVRDAVFARYLAAEDLQKEEDATDDNETAA